MVKIDYGLVYLQAENARIGLRELSKHLKKTSQRLKYSLSILEKEGIIKSPYCIFDYSYFGLILFRVYFKGGYISDRDKDNIIRELSNNQYIVSIYELTGEFDLAVEFASPNPSKFNKELKKIASLTPTLNDYKITLNLVTHVYPRNYLTKNEDFQRLNMERILGGDREREEFNLNEIKIMKNLLHNPTMRLVEFAKNTELNVKTVKSVLNNLTKKKRDQGI